MVRIALLALAKEVTQRVIPLRRVGALVNSREPGMEQMRAQILSRVVRTLRLNTRHRASGAVLQYDPSYVKVLASGHA